MGTDRSRYPRWDRSLVVDFSKVLVPPWDSEDGDDALRGALAQIRQYGYVSPRWDLVELEGIHIGDGAGDSSDHFIVHSVADDEPVDIRTYWEWLDKLPPVFFMPDGSTRWGRGNRGARYKQRKSNSKGGRVAQWHWFGGQRYRIGYHIDHYADARAVYKCVVQAVVVQGGYKEVELHYTTRPQQWCRRRLRVYGEKEAKRS